MTRIDVNNYDIIAKIFIMSRQFFRYGCDNWWPKWIVQIADEIRFRQLEYGGIAMDASNHTSGSHFRRN